MKPYCVGPARGIIASLALIVGVASKAQVVPPQLNSISYISGSPINAATTPSVTFDFSLTSGTNPALGTSIGITDPNGIELSISAPNLTSGTWAPIGGVWLNGTYTLTDFYIGDVSDAVDYKSGGQVQYTGADDQGPQTDPINPPITFRVTGGLNAIAAPTVNSISLLTPSVLPGQDLDFSVNISPGSIWPLLQLTIIVQDPNLGQKRLTVESPTLSPSITVTVPVTTAGGPNSDPLTIAGAYTVVGIQLSDGYSQVSYGPSGVILGRAPETVGFYPSPSIFSALGFTVSGTPTPQFNITSQPASASVTTGSPASFSVSTSGSVLGYQWSFNGQPITGATGSSYSIPSATLANSGSYSVVVTGTEASLTSQGALLAVAPATGGPEVTTQPMDATAVAGSIVAFNAGATQSEVTYQWYHDGLPITNGTIAGDPTLLLFTASANDAGAYSCLISDTVGSVLTTAATLSISSTNDQGRLTDLSCRAPVGTGAGILIAGFATGGAGTNGNQTLLVRGSGPALTQFNLSGLLPDPALSLFDSQQQQIAGNSGWAGSAAVASAATQVGAFSWNSASSHDSALLQTLSPGSYTAQVSGASGDTGLGLVEVYDDTPTGSFTPTSPRLVNLSARIDSGTGANVLIAGFYIGGSTSTTVLIRGSGPALAQFSLSGLLPDPELQVFDASQKLIASNTGWRASTEVAVASAVVGAFSWGASPTPDSALVLTLPPGAYTAQVSGASGDTGVALVEIYDLP